MLAYHCTTFLEKPEVDDAIGTFLEEVSQHFISCNNSGFSPFYFFVCFVEIYGVYYEPQMTGANKLTGKIELVILRKA